MWLVWIDLACKPDVVRSSFSVGSYREMTASCRASIRLFVTGKKIERRDKDLRRGDEYL